LLSKSVKNSLGRGDWGINKGEKQTTATAIYLSFRLRLHSGLRQGGSAFGAAF
jgi:hypothetical protein